MVRKIHAWNRKEEVIHVLQKQANKAQRESLDSWQEHVPVPLQVQVAR